MTTSELLHELRSQRDLLFAAISLIENAVNGNSNEAKKEAILNHIIIKKNNPKKKRNISESQRKAISEARKKYWAALTPRQRKIHVNKMIAGRNKNVQ